MINIFLNSFSDTILYIPSTIPSYFYCFTELFIVKIEPRFVYLYYVIRNLCKAKYFIINNHEHENFFKYSFTETHISADSHLMYEKLLIFTTLEYKCI